MSDKRDPTTQAIADLLERSGHTPEQAQALAEEVIQRTRTVSEGCTYGGLHPEGLAQLWNTAARNGKRRLVLEVTAEGLTPDEYHGQIGVRVLETEVWPKWSETDYLARDLTAPQVWTPPEDRSSWPFKNPLANLLDEEQGSTQKKRDAEEMN